MINYSFSIANFEYFLLILVRIASFVYIAPFFGDNAVPARVKTGLSAFVALFMYNIIERPQLSYVSAVGFAVLVVKEGITGLLIGFAANICNSIVIFAGNLIDMDIGLSMATEFNPSMNSETTVTGNFYYYVVLVLLLVSDMHTYLIRAVCDSFSVVPLGGAQFQFDNMAQFSLALEECTQQFNIVCKVINCTQSLDYADRYFARSKFIFDRMTEREKIVRFVFEEERRIRRREME